MTIRFLPPLLRERIAAGEVIDRPAAVVKELIENAIDAAARQVVIEIRAGGYGLIRVTDDGVGIPSDQLALAIARHATSKVREGDDLIGIGTLGFRGEALASIAAIADLTIASRQAESSVGASLTVRGGTSTAAGFFGGAAGTVVTVRDLFFNVPARRSPTGTTRETTRIGDLVSAYALAHSRIRFRLVSQGQPLLTTTGEGGDSARQAVFGEVASRLLPVRGDDIDGFISPPGTSRSDRRHLVLVINGRPVFNPSLYLAVESAFRALLPRGRHPVGMLRLTLEPRSVDANVHPGKLEVRLSNDAEVRDALAAAVEEALRGRLAAPAWPKKSVLSVSGGQATFGKAFGVAEDKPPLEHSPPNLAALRPLGQVDDSYIVAAAPDGLYLIDQHRAHERILFDDMQAEPRLIDDPDDLEDQALASCRSALKKGQILDAGEQAELLRRLAEAATPFVCPHGSPIVVRFDFGFVRRQFGRR